jgi:hypothetical protein
MTTISNTGPNTSANHISTVRQALLDTIKDLRDPNKPMDIGRARAISEVAQTIINSAKVEVDYLRATKQASTPFLEVPPDEPYLKITKPPEGHNNGIVSITRHKMGD